MVPLIVSLLVISLSPWVQARGTNKCNDDCLTKSYSITKDGLIGCSGADNCLMEGSFKANLINGQAVLNINLIGYHFAALKEGTFSVVLVSGNIKNKYSCSVSSYGATSAQVTVDGSSYSNGSTQVDHNNLYCSWYMVYDSEIWPKFDGTKATFQGYSDLKVLFDVDDKKFAVASSVVDLPIYQMQFLNCCYKVHGNDVYKVVVHQTDVETNFLIRTLAFPYILSASFTDSNGKQLIFDCYLSSNNVKGYLKTEALTDEISDQLFLTSFIKSTQCSWSLPLTVKASFSTYDTTNGHYFLEILADSQIVYSESNVPLKSLAPNLASSLLMVWVTFLIRSMFNFISIH